MLCGLWWSFTGANQFHVQQTHAPHQLGHETKHIKFQDLLLLEKNSDVAKKG